MKNLPLLLKTSLVVLPVTLLLFGLVPKLSQAASVYYVDISSASANDNNSGTETSPWKTIQKAASTLKAGDKVIVKPGTYTGEVYPQNSGTASAYITYEARPGAIINGAGIVIKQKQYIEIIGFKIQNTSGTGIYVVGPNTRHINIKNNHTWNTGGSGIAVWGRDWGYDPAECNYDCASDILVEGNRIERANNVKIGGGYNEHLTVASGVKRITIKKNTLTAGAMPAQGFEAISGGEGIDLKEGVTDAWVYENEIHDMVYCRYGIYIDAGGSTWGYPSTYKTVPGWMRNIHVYNNKVYRNDGHGIGIVSEGSGNMEKVYVYNNIVYQNGNDGILVYDWGLTGKNNPPNPLPVAKDIYVFNNTVYKNAQIRNWYGGIAIDHKFANNIVIRNNLTFGNPSNIRKYNVPSGTVIDTNLETTGQVKNADTADFSLPSNSTAIDAGSSNLPINLTFDFNQIQRPFNLKFDIGAHEYSYTPPAQPAPAPTPSPLTVFETVSVPNSNTTTIYLSNLIPLNSTNGWGPYERDSSNGENLAGDGKPITINGVTYQKGLGVHSLSEITYSIPSTCTNFMSSIGLDDEVDVRGSVVFQVYANGSRIFDSGKITNISPTQNINLSLNKITTLQLVVQNGGDDYGSDHASWGDAKIICTQPSLTTQAQSNPVTINPAILSSSSVTPGQTFSITYNWKGGPTSKPLTSFVHFINSDNKLVFQDDHIPVITSTLWNNTPLAYMRNITLPVNIPIGNYKIMAGLYDPATGARQTLSQGTGVTNDTTEGQRYQIGMLNVTTTLTTPPTPTPVTQPIPTPAPQPAPVLPQGPWTAQYFNWTSNSNYFKTPVLTRTDNAINFDWGRGTPAAGVTGEKFAVRWSAEIDFPTTGTYNFNVQTDDGIRIWIDNTLVLNRWQDQATSYKFSRSLNAGKHSIRVDYYEHTVDANAKLSWTLGSVAGATTPVKITQNLSKGYANYSYEVYALQQYLYENGYLNTEPVGVFGSQTEAAVIKLQNKYGITPTGIVGPVTRKVINGE